MDLKDDDGNLLTYDVADKLLHEFISHAIPKILKDRDMKSGAVEEENKASEQIDGEKPREVQPNHKICKKCKEE